MAKENSEAPVNVGVVELSGRSIVMVLVIGFLVGAVGWLAYSALQTWVVNPVLCDEASSACRNGGTVSYWFAMIVASGLGLIALIRSGVYRPLLVVIAALAALYGVQSWLQGLSWYEAAAWQGLLYAVVYGLLSWVSRIASFGLTLVLFVTIVAAVRLALSWL